MKALWGLLLVGLLASPALADELETRSLVAVDHPPPGTAERLLERDVMVVRDLERFLLAVAAPEDRAFLDATGLAWDVLDREIGGKSYYTVMLRRPGRLAELRRQVRVLKSDGFDAVIEASPARAKEVAGAGFEIAKVFLRPIRPAPVREAPDRMRSAVADSLVQAMVEEVSGAAVDTQVQRLQDFVTRYAAHDSCQAAANYIKAEFESYGIDSVVFHSFSPTYKPNVVAVIPGRAFPERLVVIGGHYDSITSNHNNCPGADDDASGTACVLECARVLANFEFNYTLVFIAFGAEELGLIGSEAWAADAAAAGADIIGAVCVDMIGYVAGGDAVDIDIVDNTSSVWLRDLAMEVGDLYVPELPVVDGSIPGGASSDHASFWAHGYDAILFFEDTGQYSPYIHTASDVVGTSYNNPMLAVRSVRVATGVLASLAEPFSVAISHVPLADTEDSVNPYRVVADIISAGALEPDSLYVSYATGSGPTQVTLSPTGTPDEYDAWIPAQAGGTFVDYYLVAADQSGNRVTEPSGAPIETHSFFVGTITAVINDDLESEQGWTVGDAGDNATTGIWERADPQGTWSGSVPVQPEDDATPNPGTLCFITDATAGSGQGSYDVDGGKTTLFSPVYDLSGLSNARVRYHRWYTNDTGAGPETDDWVVDVTSNGGVDWASVEVLSSSDRSWRLVEKDLAGLIDFTAQVQFRFIARDDDPGSIVEAGVDDFSIVVYQEPATSVVVAPGGDDLFLAQNAPNPFGSNTGIRFHVPAPGRKVTLGVFDVAGRKVAGILNGELVSGTRSVTWDGRDGQGRAVASGVYYYRLDLGDRTLTRRLVILR